PNLPGGAPSRTPRRRSRIWTPNGGVCPLTTAPWSPMPRAPRSPGTNAIPGRCAKCSPTPSAPTWSCTGAGRSCSAASRTPLSGSPPSRRGRRLWRRTPLPRAVATVPSRWGRRPGARPRERGGGPARGARPRPGGAGPGMARPRAGRRLAESAAGAVPAGAAGQEGAAGPLPRQRAGHAVELRQARRAVRGLLHRTGRVLQLSKGGPAYAVYLFSGIVVINLFGEVFGNATRSITDNQALVSKIYLPSELFPWASMIVAFIHFVPQVLVLLVGAMLFGWSPTLVQLGALGMGIVILVVF